MKNHVLNGIVGPLANAQWASRFWVYLNHLATELTAFAMRPDNIAAGERFTLARFLCSYMPTSRTSQ